jgi:hypothetical protein
MSIYSTTPVELEPTIYLERWSVRRTDAGDFHLVGFNVAARDGRVSTEVRAFDTVRRRALTASGRRYQLVGPGGYDPDAEYVWNWAVSAWEIDSWTDVTAELVPEWRRSLPDSMIVDDDVDFDATTLMPIRKGGLSTDPVSAAPCNVLWRKCVNYRMTARRMSLTDTTSDENLISAVKGGGTISLSQAIEGDEASCFLTCVGLLFRPNVGEGATILKEVPRDPLVSVTIERLSQIEDTDGDVIATLGLVEIYGVVYGSLSVAQQMPRELGSTHVVPECGLWEVVARFLLGEDLLPLDEDSVT